MATVIGIVISSVVFTFSLWLSVKVLGGSESANKLGTAAVVGVLFSTFAAFVPIAFGLLPLVALFLILLRWYDLGVLRSIGVIVLMGLLQFLAGLLLAAAEEALGVV